MNKFPADFLWGTATAAAQVEGGWKEGGRTPSIWDVASKDKIRDKSDNHVADDHFHRYKEDVRLMKAIGVNSYRFSISWSRVVPEEGKISEEGLQFYSDLVDELLKAGIEPLVMLYQGCRGKTFRQGAVVDAAQRAADLHRARSSSGYARAL